MINLWNALKCWFWKNVMIEFITEYYNWFLALHVIAVISWMAGMLYLPRLYIYHCRLEVGSDASEMFKEMERKLLRVIINPAMIIAWICGLLMAIAMGFFDAENSGWWFHAKLSLVLILSGFHGYLSKWRKAFERDENQKTEKFYRLANEIPTVLMIFIVILVIFKPS